MKIPARWAGFLLAWVLCLPGLAGARLQVDPPVYELGEVPEGLVLEMSFTITNSGDEPVGFPQGAKITCPCTQAELPRDRLGPGETMEVRVIFDSHGFSGLVEREILLPTDQPGVPPARLRFRVEVVPAPAFASPVSQLQYDFYLLVDLRSPEEYARGHLLGAVNIPWEELPAWLDRLPQGLAIFLYDETGGLAEEAAGYLQERGYPAALALVGGLAGWQETWGDLLVWGELPAAMGQPVEGSGILPLHLAGILHLLIDLRPAEEFAQGHLLGAVNLPVEEVPGWLSTLSLPEGIPIWCLDEAGEEACRLAQALQELGYSGARCLLGGLSQWRLLTGGRLWWGGPGSE
jgi:rhodanese-related sulfurtransferase